MLATEPTIQTLPEGFQHEGFDFKLVCREGDVALLSKTKPGFHRDIYELVIIQHHPSEIIRGRHYPARERMPRSEDWGTLGWTLVDLPAALDRFSKLAQVHGNGRGILPDEPEPTSAVITLAADQNASTGKAPLEKEASLVPFANTTSQ